ncbi:putative membrane protein required for colicin V production [Aneurinibacillus soli]|uniref:Colicin V production protein n=1 Tax=Aneurinibacillus soli TaxID=1500254 RepID=A0A0U5ASW6_9BACL|nr:CvpA family protein [Aneurinibacillus soli]PYE57902.1 putative membrane protein required for colicin V production [Aneurinibacillus soli]BAU26913.1 Colicin V production protein [Aneurinibacillus soli]
MNILDIIIVVVLLLSFWRGWHQGFVMQLTKIAGLILSAVVAFWYHRPVAEQLSHWIPLSGAGQSASSFAALPFVQNGLYNIVAFALLAFVTGLVVRYIGSLLNSVAQLPVLSMINRLAGSVVAFVKTGIIFLLILAVVSLIPVESVQHTLAGSSFASYAKQEMPAVLDWVKQEFNQPTSHSKNSTL